MSDKLSFRQLRFIEGIEAGKSLVDAYMGAGYKAKRGSAYHLASNLVRNDKILTVLEERVLDRKTLAQQRLGSMLDGATNVYIRILKLDAKSNEKLLELQRRVSVDVFDRMGVKPKLEQELSGALKIEFLLPRGQGEGLTIGEERTKPARAHQPGFPKC